MLYRLSFCSLPCIKPGLSLGKLKSFEPENLTKLWNFVTATSNLNSVKHRRVIKNSRKRPGKSKARFLRLFFQKENISQIYASWNRWVHIYLKVRNHSKKMSLYRKKKYGSGIVEVCTLTWDPIFINQSRARLPTHLSTHPRETTYESSQMRSHNYQLSRKHVLSHTHTLLQSWTHAHAQAGTNPHPITHPYLFIHLNLDICQFI